MLSVVIFTLILGGVVWGLDWAADSWVHPYCGWVLLFFFLITLVGHWFTERGLKRNRENFMSIYLGVTGFRLLISILFIGIFIYKRIPDLYVFVINFFVLYLSYVGFEIRGVLGNLRRDSPEAS